MQHIEPTELQLGRTERVRPGVFVQRRSFLGLAAAALCATAHGQRPPRLESGGDATLSFEEFLAEVVPIARTLVADTSRVGEDRYLLTLASFAVRLADVPEPEMRDTTRGDGPRKFIGHNPGGDPFHVLHWRLEPGAVITTHAHTHGNVVTLGLAGAARVRNWEMVGDRDFAAKGTFRVRLCKEQILTPHETNLVPLAHGYCHGFVGGPDGARGLDITTRILTKRASPCLDVASVPVDEAMRIYEASWKDEEG